MSRIIMNIMHGPIMIDAVRMRADFDMPNARLYGRVVSANGIHWSDYGNLSGPDMDAFRRDHDIIRYVVWQGRTPLLWVTLAGREYRTVLWHGVAL